jgi:hypothetical protein
MMSTFEDGMKQMVDLIERIKWSNKLSRETINLEGKEIQEIQIFEIELRKQDDITGLLQVVDKAISYPIIFNLQFKDNVCLVASQKHKNPVNEDVAVIDWTFSTGWFKKEKHIYRLNLERNLDFIFLDFCKQLANSERNIGSMLELVSFEKKFYELSKSILKLRTAISKATQFNQKVKLNIDLQTQLKKLQLLKEE